MTDSQSKVKAKQMIEVTGLPEGEVVLTAHVPEVDTTQASVVPMEKIVRQLLRRLHLAYCSTHDSLFSTEDRRQWDYECPLSRMAGECQITSEYEW